MKYMRQWYLVAKIFLALGLEKWPRPSAACFLRILPTAKARNSLVVANCEAHAGVVVVGEAHRGQVS